MLFHEDGFELIEKKSRINKKLLVLFTLSLIIGFSITTGALIFRHQSESIKSDHDQTNVEDNDSEAKATPSSTIAP